MKKLFTEPTLSVKNFEVENIVTTSLTGQAVDESNITALKTRNDIDKITLKAQTVLTFSE